MNHRAVFLDRDGVINRALVCGGKPCPPRSGAQLELLDGVPEALSALKAAGYHLVLVTNQPDIARSTTSREAVERMHAWLQSILPLDAVFMCPHDDADQCGCRKPLPGLITRAAHELRLDCAASYLVGDRWRDIEAGQRAGCRTFFVDHGYDEPEPRGHALRVGSLFEAASLILRTERAT